MSHVFLILKKPSFLNQAQLQDFSLFVFLFSLKQLFPHNGVSLFLPFYLFTFLPLKSLFTFKKPFYL